MERHSPFGTFGNLMWRTIPELRPAISEMIQDRLQTAILIEEDPDIDIGDFRSVIGRYILTPMAEGTEDPHLVSRLAELIREVVAYDGEDKEVFQHDAELFFFENLQFEPALSKLEAVDPGISAVVTDPFPLKR